VSSRTFSPENGVLAKWGGVHIRPDDCFSGNQSSAGENLCASRAFHVRHFSSEMPYPPRLPKFQRLEAQAKTQSLVEAAPPPQGGAHAEHRNREPAGSAAASSIILASPA
jgi:hypothetical protein